MKIAVIGYGHRMAEVARNLKRACAETEIVAVCDPARETVRAVMEKDGLLLPDCRFYEDSEALLAAEKPDGVMVGTRCSLHARLGAQVLRRGLPLFLEKPIATRVEDAKLLWQAYCAGGRPPVVVSFPLRVTSIARFAREVLDSGRLGELSQVQAVNNVPYGQGYFQRWYRDERETGGLFLQKATHDIDVVNLLLNQRPVKVCAMTSKQIFRGSEPAGMRCDACPKADICTESPANLKRFFQEERRDLGCCFATDTGNEDSGSAIIRYESGLHCVYSQNFVVRKQAACRKIRVIGYRGTMEFDWYTGQLRVLMHDSGIAQTVDFNGGDAGHWGGDRCLTESFADCVRKGAPSVSPLEAGMDSVLTCLAARQSGAREAFLPVENFRAW